MDKEKEVFEKLTKLQDRLNRKFALENEIEKLPRDLEVKQNLLALINKEYTEVTAQAQQAKAELKDLRFQYDDVVAQRESSEKKMESISTQREFEALQKEIKDASEKEQSLLRQLHAKEQQISDLDARFAEKESLLKIQQGEVDSESGKIEELTSQKQKEREELEQECRSYIGTDIDQELYDKFCMIVKNKRGNDTVTKDGETQDVNEGKGIVPIHGLVCQGCHIVLPIQFVNNVRNGDSIQFCPYCSRILYYEEVEGAEKDFVKPVKDDGDVMEEEKGSTLSDFTDEDEFNDIV